MSKRGSHERCATEDLPPIDVVLENDHLADLPEIEEGIIFV